MGDARCLGDCEHAGAADQEGERHLASPNVLLGAPSRNVLFGAPIPPGSTWPR
jgi:hypothetical protein